MDVRATALLAHDIGLTVLPCHEDGSKRPDGLWKDYQVARPTAEQVRHWYANGRAGVGLITGTPRYGSDETPVGTQRLECFEFDDSGSRYEPVKAAAEALGLGDVVHRIETGYLERSPSGGVHWLYWCDTVGGNTELARRPTEPHEREHEKDDTRVLIETRGVGGYIVIAPSHGTVHKTGRPYVKLAGDLPTIATISADERAALWELARTFNEVVDRADIERGDAGALHRRPAVQGNGGRPGDDFNARAEWADVLEPHGWLRAHERAGIVYWTRPGKDAREGWSATENYASTGKLYVFSTSTALPAGRSYDKFAALAYLDHGGDFSETARSLVRLGYGDDGIRTYRPTDRRGGSLPTIIVSNRQLRDSAQDAIAALVAANDPPVVFVRGGGLARVRRDEEGRPVLDVLGSAELRGRLARVANFVRVKSTKDGSENNSVTPPLELAQDILALGEWPDLPPLSGVTRAPTLRPDGSILSRPGYDPATRLLFVPAGDDELPEIPETPTRADAQAAAAAVLDLLTDFPFVDEASGANAVAEVITPLIRPTIAGSVPMVINDAPSRGTGKGLLAQIPGVLATGAPPPMTSPPAEDEELRKLLTTFVMSGTELVVFDNVEQRVAWPSLSRFLTALEWQDRLLGRSEKISFPNRSVLMMTGNNVRLGGDMPRRTYWVRLDSRLARPWTRQGFRHSNLLAHVAQHRYKIVAAILTMARAWFIAGRPPAETAVLGNYEDWTRIVGGILVYAGIAGFLANQPDLYDRMDEVTPAWEGFCEAWYQALGEQSYLVAELVERLKVDSSFRLALPDDLSETLDADMKGQRVSFSRRLGKALSSRADVIFGEYRLERGLVNTHAKQAAWRVARVADAAGFAGNAGFGSLLSRDERAQEESVGGGEHIPQSPQTPQVGTAPLPVSIPAGPPPPPTRPRL